MADHATQARLDATSRRLGVALATATALIGLESALGHALALPALTRWFPGRPGMVLSTALLLIVAASAVLSTLPTRRAWRLLSTAAGATVAIASAVQLTRYLGAFHVPAPSLLAESTAYESGWEGVASPASVLALLAFGLGHLGTQSRGRHTRRLGGVGLAVPGIVGLVALTGYAYGATFVYPVPHIFSTGMSIPTAFACVFLTLGSFAVRPRHPFTRVFTSEAAGGALSRWLLLPGLFGPAAIGWLAQLAHDSGLTSLSTGFATVSAAFTAAGLALLWLAAARLNAQDLRRREASAWLSTVIEVTPEPIIVVRVGRDGRRHWSCNAAALTLTMAPSEPAPPEAHPDLDLRRPGGPRLPLHDWPIERALATGRGVAPEALEAVTAAGTHRSLLASAAPVALSGHLAGAIGLFHDVTAMKVLERQREEWTSVIAHDLRQPVSAISLTSEYLLRKRGPDLSDFERESLQAIIDSARSLERMIADLLDTSRIDAARLSIYPERVTVAALVRHTLARRCAPVPGRRVDVCVPEDLPPVDVDPDRMEQVLANLLTNAMKYGEPGTPVRVEARRRGDELVVSVVNRGQGIPIEVVPRLFERFYRSPNSQSPGGPKGIGLGLYITRSLVEAHGGRVWVESTPGEETWFSFSLPIAPDPDAPHEPPHSVSPRS